MDYQDSGEWVCADCNIATLENVSANDFISIFGSINCKNAKFSGEELLEYLASTKRVDILSQLTVENLVRAAYDSSIRASWKHTGEDFVRMNMAHCPEKQLSLFRELANEKGHLAGTNYDYLYLHQTALFDICRRNDAEMLKVYLDGFNGYCPDEIYDAVFDYYIYMYLPDWTLLKRYNEEKDHGIGGIHFEYCAGALAKTSNEKMETAMQQEMLDVLIQQAEKCKVQRPEVLEILFQHHIPSYRRVFSVEENQLLHFGINFTPTGSWCGRYGGQLLLYYDDVILSKDLCVDPEAFNELLSDSACACPITCTCGFPGCGGIETCSESRMFKGQMRLYIPLTNNVYYFHVENRFELHRELLLMLKHLVRLLRCHERWTKMERTANRNEDDDEEEEEYAAFSPNGWTLSGLQKLAKKIEAKLQMPRKS